MTILLLEAFQLSLCPRPPFLALIDRLQMIQSNEEAVLDP